MRFSRVLFALCCFCSARQLCAQWEIQDAHTTASLRGIHYVGNGVAWASGTDGTVLRTEDMGFVWQLCTVPPGAEKLDFRGVQAIDNNTAIVMSSGKGDLSRLYKTTDGCQTWKLVFTNPDKDGFWDAVKFVAGDEVVVLGDSVLGKHQLWHWSGEDDTKPLLMKLRDDVGDDEESSFAASNSVLELAAFPAHDASPSFDVRWAAGTAKKAYIYLKPLACRCSNQPSVKRVAVPLQTGAHSSGVFALEFRDGFSGVAVGGDFSKPDQTGRTAAYSQNGGLSWKIGDSQPSGYRSSVAYDSESKCWITVGPNGTDISTDDGRNWHPLKPGPGDAPDSNQHWNALSLPFAVGPKGRIGLLRAYRLQGK